MTSHFIRRSLIVAAIALMITSALISALLVHANDRHIASLHKEQAEMDESIRAIWDDAGRTDRSVDTAIIISLLGTNDSAQAALKQQYLARLKMPSNTSATSLLALADNARRQSADAINAIFVRRSAAEEDMMKREQANAIYANVAFFLQLLSVILVILTRDMPDV